LIVARIILLVVTVDVALPYRKDDWLGTFGFHAEFKMLLLVKFCLFLSNGNLA
jgi:hypothetical protein